MTRRDLLEKIAAAGAWAASGGTAEAARRRKKPAPAPAHQLYDFRKLLRVGISSWSFHNCFASTRDVRSLPCGTMALLDFPRMIADRYQVHNLEFVAPHFASTDRAYLLQLRRQLSRVRSRLINIPVDIAELRQGGGLSDPSPSIRNTAVAAVKNWIDIARQLGARSVRADPGKINPSDLTPTIDSYRQLAAYARRRGLDCLIENHQGAEAREIVAIIAAVRSRSLGALPDFGNFATEAERTAGLRLLFPHALTVCHAKGIAFDARGNEMAFDFPSCVLISKQNHFRGIYSIEYEGAGDPYSGVQNVVNELMRYL